MKQGSPSGVRQFGQISLPSSFFRKSTKVSDEEDHQPKLLNKPPVSLSEFLNRKVTKTTGTSIKEKQSSFSSIAWSIKKDCGNKRYEDGSNFTLDESVFRKFNAPAQEEGLNMNSAVHEDGEYQSELTGKDAASRKRKNPFDAPSVTKHLVVLGDDPKPRQKRREWKIMNRDMSPYDHYASGSGWWDCDREGVDSEEVGCSEVWEGMGSTTLGGLDWH